MAPHSNTLVWKIPWKAAVHGVAEDWTRLSHFTFTFHCHALEKEMATHSSVLAWRIPGTGEPGGLPSMGLHRVGHDWSDLAATAAGLCLQCRRPAFNPWVGKIPWRRKWQPTAVLLPWKSHERRSLVQATTIHGVAKSRARLSDFTFFHFPVLLAGKSQGQRILEGYMGSQESDMT